MIRNCEPEFRERVVVRVRRRAEIQKREAEAVDSPTSVVSAGPRTASVYPERVLLTVLTI
jgi:hypothetical protein